MASTSLSNIAIQGLEFELPKRADTQHHLIEWEGTTAFFCSRHVLSATPTVQKQESKKIERFCVYWDASKSRRDQDKSLEIE